MWIICESLKMKIYRNSIFSVIFIKTSNFQHHENLQNITYNSKFLFIFDNILSFK